MTQGARVGLVGGSLPDIGSEGLTRSHEDAKELAPTQPAGLTVGCVDQRCVQETLATTGARCWSFPDLDALQEGLQALLTTQRSAPAICIIVHCNSAESRASLKSWLLARGNCSLPVVCLDSGPPDVGQIVALMRHGLADYLALPADLESLRTSLHAAWARSAKARSDQLLLTALQTSYASLTPREKQVMAAVADGKPNKCIALGLGITEKTVKVHRGNLMRKMGARSQAELVRSADLLGIAPPLQARFVVDSAKGSALPSRMQSSTR